MLVAMFQAKCPQCRTGQMFQHPISFTSKALKMHQHCPHCNYQFEIEPGFFWGSMYVSYAFSVAFAAVSSFLVYIFMQDPDILHYLIAITLTMILGSFASYRYSRVLMSYLFSGVKFKKEYSK